MKFVLFRTPRPTTRQRFVGTADAAPAPDKIGLEVTFAVKGRYYSNFKSENFLIGD